MTGLFFLFCFVVILTTQKEEVLKSAARRSEQGDAPPQARPQITVGLDEGGNLRVGHVVLSLSGVTADDLDPFLRRDEAQAEKVPVALVPSAQVPYEVVRRAWDLFDAAGAQVFFGEATSQRGEP